MSTSQIISLYLIGCLLSHGRYTASFYEIMEKFPTLKPVPWWCRRSGAITGVMAILLSWIGLAVGIMGYLQDEKYLFKWSYDKLLKRWEEWEASNQDL